MTTGIIRAGSILRRGTDGMRPSQLQYLLDNADKVDAILDEIEARRAVFLKTEADAKAALDKLEVASKALAEDQASLAEAVTDLEAREEIVARGKKTLTELDAWFDANPLSPIEET